ncbi:MAG TPA: UDP-N-acetylmuramoyl-L-alanine--D-glutamate ligase [Candidatus Binataceae bacterium]
MAGKRVMVVGLGTSGLAAARFLHAGGAKLTLTDKRDDVRRDLLPPAELRLGAEDPSWLTGIDLVVTSPGVPRDSVLLRTARASKIPVIGEMELASRFLDAPMIAITGTNGKSTVTVMLGDILKAAGKRVFVGGNLGKPLVEAVGPKYDALVVEVSSFQLEWIETFRPYVGVHLNLTDDHFERYRDIEDYGRAKARLFENQTASDWAILNRDDRQVWKLASSVPSRVIGFSLDGQERPSAIWHETNALDFDIADRRGRIALKNYRIPGRHNIANAMAAAAAAVALGAEETAIENALARFSPLPHRIELVREKDGVRFVDDSKGTNVGAAVEAIEGFDPPVILIAGGLDKGGDYAPLRAPLRRKVKHAIFIGAAREKMSAALCGATEIEMVATLKEAVLRAARIAQRGDTVLLSPACSSFDQFRDYAERGNLFKELVRAL